MEGQPNIAHRLYVIPGVLDYPVSRHSECTCTPSTATPPQGQWLHLDCLLSQTYGPSYTRLVTRRCIFTSIHTNSSSLRREENNYTETRESPSDIFSSITVALPKNDEYMGENYGETKRSERSAGGGRRDSFPDTDGAQIFS